MTDLFDIRDNIIYVSSAELYIDALKKKEFGFISHAHIDHIANHKKILCTKITADLIQLRLRNPKCLVLPFLVQTEINSAQITLIPAGHILGSAQIFIETDKGTLLYTGDFRTRKSRTAEPLEYRKCDVLIMETTFGMPHYIFPEREEIERNLLSILRTKLQQGVTPVVFAYSLGKGQEAMHIIGNSGLPLAVDNSILRYAAIYAQNGINFGTYEKLGRREYKNRVILLPVHLRRDRFVQNISPKYTIYLSGWGIDKGAAYGFGVDEVLPLSDHADFNEMIDFVQKVEPEKIFCTHGLDDFVFHLRNRGFNAQPLIRPGQMDLFP
jgi:Cft2 family RNA processing exonuclease